MIWGNLLCIPLHKTTTTQLEYFLALLSFRELRKSKRERDSVVFQLQNLLHRISWALSVSLRAVACRNAMPLSSSLHRRSSAAAAFRRPCYAKLRCLASDWMHLCVFCTHWAFLSFNQNGLEKPKETVFYLRCLQNRNNITEDNFSFWYLAWTWNHCWVLLSIS